MTVDEIRDEGAGRRMDAWVHDNLYPNRTHEWNDEFVILNYSTNIAAAYNVLEYMRKAGYYVGIEAYRSDVANYTCTFQIRDDDGNPLEYTIEAETLPLAICKAFLEALEEPRP